MLRRLLSLPRRILRRSTGGLNLLLAMMGNPALAKEAFTKVMARRARLRQSKERASRLSLPTFAKGSLDRTALLNGLAREMGVLLLRDTPQRAHIGLAEIDLLAALHWLEAATAEPTARIGGRDMRVGSFGFGHRALAAPVVQFAYRGPDGRMDELRLEPYFRRGPAHWVSANPKNIDTRALYDDALAAPGLIPLQKVLGGPSFSDMVEARPVDVVYTWVNHEDPDWAQLYARYKEALTTDQPVDGGQPALAVRPQSQDATALSRFHSNDELRYSLRSVAQNLPWVRQIYVFTNCAPPAWLKQDHPGVIWVQHEAVIPQAYLPTFSSHVIESFLHRIPGLEQQFIYINDDVFIAKPLGKDFFFDANGCSRSLLEPYGMVSGPVKPGDPDYLNASRNSVALLQESFGFAPTRLHRHTSFALRRDVLEEIEARWPARFDLLRSNRFRTAQDINVTSFLYHHYGLATGKALVAGAKNAFIKSLDIRWKAQLAETPALNPDIICLNEGGDALPSPDWHSSVRRFLKEKWPDPAPWEQS